LIKTLSMPKGECQMKELKKETRKRANGEVEKVGANLCVRPYD